MFHIVYKITNNMNGKFYIGIHSTANINDGYMGSGKIIKRAIKQHGIDNFKKEILFIFDTRDEALLKEQELVTEDLVTNDNCYNLVLGGGDAPHCPGEKNGMYGRTHTEEARRKMSEVNIGHSRNKGIPKTEEHKRNLSKSLKGKMVGELNPNYGNKMSAESRKSISEKNKGKVHSEEARLKMSISGKGKTKSVDHKEKLRQSNLGKTENKVRGSDHHRYRGVIQKLDKDMNVISEYVNALDAYSEGYTQSGISDVLFGRQKTHRGYFWRIKPNIT